MVTTTWTATSARSWRPTNSPVYGSGGWRTENRAYQGQWENFGLHRGLWFFNDANIRSTLAGRTVTQVRVRLTRWSTNHGVFAAQTPTIRLHNYSSQPSGTPTMGSGTTAHGQSWALGDTHWATLPVSWGNALRDGNGRGIGVYSPSNSPYLIFTANAILEVTHEPSVQRPPTPGGLTQTGATQTSASWACDPVATAESYEFNREGQPYVSRPGPTFTDTGLPSGFQGRWRVRARNGAGSSLFGDWVTGWTLPATPANLRQTGSTHTSITVTADPVSGATSYDFQPESAEPNVANRSTPVYTHGGRTPGQQDRYRVRSRNAAGAGPWSQWVTARAAALPNAPTLETVGTVNRLQTNRFRWTVAHPDGGTATAGFQVQFRPQGAGTVQIDETRETTSQHYDVASGTLSAGGWEWRARVRDTLGGWGPFAGWSSFDAIEPPAGPTILSPIPGVPVPADVWTVEWSAAEQHDWQGQILDGSDVLYDTDAVEDAEARQAEFPYPDNNVTRTTRIRVRRQGLWSGWSSVTHPVAFTPPEAPFVFLDVHTTPGAIRVAAFHPTPMDDTPQVMSQDIWRRLLEPGPHGVEQIRVAADLSPAATFTDWAVVSLTGYEYLIRVWGENGASAESAWTSDVSQQLFSLTVEIEGEGTVSGAGLYLEGQIAVLVAAPRAGWMFVGWSGPVGGAANPLELVMEQNETVTAHFEEDPDWVPPADAVTETVEWTV